MAAIFEIAYALASALDSIVTEEDAARSKLNLWELHTVEALDSLLRKARALVGRRINLHRPVYRLPAEILVHIFSLVSIDHKSWEDSINAATWGPRASGGQPRRLVPLTTVCWRWRSILLETPLLWSTIEDNGSEDIPSFTYYVHRCPRGPLFVHITSQPHDATRDLLASHSDRVQDLIVEDAVGNGHFPDTIASFRADSLRRFRLSLRDREYTGRPFQTFFHNGAPQLREMQLEFSLYLPHNDFPALTHLIIECPSAVSFTLQDLQTFLSGCPDLQVLHLLKISSPSSLKAPGTTTTTAPRSLHFRHLRKLSIVDAMEPHSWPTTEQIARFVANRGAIQRALLASTIPPQCLVYLAPVCSIDLQALADRMSTIIMPSSMRIVDADQSYSAPSASARISLVLVQPSQSRGVRFDVQYRRCNEDKEDVKANMCRAVASSPLFADVRELWMDTGSADFLCWPDSLFAGLPRLSYLSIRCSEDEGLQPDDVLQALSEVQAGELVCPELDTLVLTITAERIIWDVRDLVLRRHTVGRPLTHLWVSLSLADVSEEALQAAQELGSFVDHFVLENLEDDETGDTEERDWIRSWDERVPAGCGVADEIEDPWPVWVERVTYG